jgi:hypothetical protein
MSRHRLIAAAVALGLVVLAGCGADRPEYNTASSIADALNGDGITCTFEPAPPTSSLPGLVESSGVCRGVDFVVFLLVFGDADARRESQAEWEAHWCSEGITKGSYVAAGRWLVSIEVLPSNDWLYMNDIADATGGERFPIDCG